MSAYEMLNTLGEKVNPKNAALLVVDVQNDFCSEEGWWSQIGEKGALEMGKKMLELYKENKINPFAGLFLIIIQIPVVIALYFVFRSGFPAVNLDILYSFVPTPTMVDTNFLNFIDLSANNNILVALLAGVSQYYQMLFVMKKNEKPKEEKKQDSPMEDIMKMMQFQMKNYTKYLSNMMTIWQIT